MVPVLTTVFCVITLLVSLILPILALVVYALRHKKQGVWSAWGLGALGFVIPQMCIRSPILAVLQKQNWFLLFAQNHLFAYTFCLALTAGLFELVWGTAGLRPWPLSARPISTIWCLSSC